MSTVSDILPPLIALGVYPPQSGGGGTVTSVGLSAPAEFTVSGSPVTGSGTLTFTKATQPANFVYVGPTTGAAAAPAFRALVTADLPAGVALLASNNTFTKTQTVQPVAQNISGAVTIDLSQSNTFYLTVTGNVTGWTFNNPVNGTVYNLHINENGTGGFSIAALPAAFAFPGGVAPTFTTTANARNFVSAQYDSASTTYDAAFLTSGSGGTPGTVTSISAQYGVATSTGSPITSTGTLIEQHLINAQTGTTYTFLASDRGAHVTFNSASGVAVTLPQAGTTGFENGFMTYVKNLGNAQVTITPTTSTINGGSTLILRTNQSAFIFSDGTNYDAFYLDQAGVLVNAQTGTTYTVLARDNNKLVTFTNASAIAVTLPQATGAFGSGWRAFFQNRGAGTVTITPTTSTIDGAASIALTTNQGVLLVSDGTNYFSFRGISGASGLTNFTEAVNSSGVNATVPVVSLTPNNASTSVDIAYVPKGGNGAFIAAVPDGASTGGNKRGSQAVDLQLARSSATQVASGIFSFVAGHNSTGSGQTSFALGDTVTASGDYSTAIGNQATTRGVQGMFAHAASAISATGDAQVGQYVLSKNTTNATPVNLTADQSNQGTTNSVVLVNNSAYYVRGRCIAQKSGAADTKSWSFEGQIVRGANAASTALTAAITPTVVAASGGASTWSLAVTADTTNGALQVQATGQAATDIYWVCVVDTVEVVH